MKRIKSEEEFIKWIKNRKTLMIIFIVFILLAMSFYFFLSFYELRIKEINMENYNIVNNKDYLFNIEDNNLIIDSDSNTLMIKGWIVKPNVKINKISLKVILKNIDDNKSYIIPTIMENRDDYKKIIDDGIDHNASGFCVYINTDKIDNNSSYSIYVLMNLNGEEMIIPMDKNVNVVIRDAK